MFQGNSSTKANNNNHGRGRFETTSWTIVLKATATDQGEAASAFADLCQVYWRPLRTFLRNRGSSPEDAEDIMQSFFASLLEGNALSYADPRRGRFRSFLLASLKQFVARRRRFESAKKRAPDRPPVRLDAAESGTEFTVAGSSRTPQQEYERAWALAVLARAMSLLEAEYQQTGKSALYGALAGSISGQASQTTRELAERLGITEVAVRKAQQRMKLRFGQVVRQEIAQTIDDPSELDDELRYLLSALKN